MFLSPLCFVLFVAVSATLQITTAIDKTFIIKLAPGNSGASLSERAVGQHEIFHKRAASLDYSVRHEFKNADVFLGLSIRVTGSGTNDEIQAQLQSIAGVVEVTPVYNVSVPTIPGNPPPLDPSLSYPNPPPLNAVTGTGNLSSSLEMGGVDKLHQLGIKGKGIKIGVVDTGVDYRHPALGAGFGPGYKIAGGYSFVLDNGTLANGSDPLTTCYGGGHGTHVSGILAMDSVSGGFDIVGVAPEATIYMYRAFDCTGHGGSDTIIAAMSKAQEDGVDIVSMSLGIGPQSFDGEIDPVAAITQTLTQSGIAVIVAMANDASGSMYNSELYSEEWPSTEPSAIGVGAISNTEFPLVYSAIDSAGATIHYASVYPLNFTNGADVFILGDGCDSSTWDSALAAIENVNETIIAFQVDGNCKATSAGSWSSSTVKPVYIMAFNANSSDPYLSAYDTPSQGYFGTTEFINLNAADGTAFNNNFAAAGGYLKYKLKFISSSFVSVPQPSGGLMDYYSNFGPTWHDYDLKPQISAPGGHILSTWPLGPLGGYAILSGTSMATPYLAACYALVKSQFPKATIEQIRELLQTNANPVPWVYDTSILSATAQQGAGLVNAYNAIFTTSTISPGQIKISDVTHTIYGTANITIENTSTKSKTYSLSHQGAGYMDYYLSYMEINQQANYGTASFSKPTVTIAAGQSATIGLSITPPSNVVPSSLPVFGGFIKVTDTDAETFHVPYLGPPYSLFNTPYLLIEPISAGPLLPQIYAFNSDQSGITVDMDFLEVDPSNGFSSDIPTLQWTTAFRVDVLPADTSITANHYGFNTSKKFPYVPSSLKPNSTIFGYPSFGTLVNETGLIGPSGGSVSGSDTSVTASNGVSYQVGNGDYRWFASVLRWGGDLTKQEDYDTWLGPIIRFVNSTS